MKKILVMACMMFGSTLATNATGSKMATKAPGDKSSNTLASSRAKHLSDQMIRGLQLNNYQSGKIREINLKVAEQITAIEENHAGNQAQIDALSKEVYAERDRFLENVLSTVQYNDYFGHRKAYTAMDKEYTAKLNGTDTGGDATATTTPGTGSNTLSAN
ncbi:hypothetical protein ACFS7Z_00340 [Pontibacter toksunensis]|uniref:Uncharacterized protein n=1 Tax=Pontibacter toksunensis TaxID=1332631 RepID=A0ABW6BPH5_9BACT